MLTDEALGQPTRVSGIPGVAQGQGPSSQAFLSEPPLVKRSILLVQQNERFGAAAISQRPLHFGEGVGFLLEADLRDMGRDAPLGTGRTAPLVR